MINLIDHKDNKINENDIVKFENLKTNEDLYYLYSEKFLYKYDKKGNINPKHLGNIKVDSGVTLCNDDVMKWTRIGTNEEVYSKIFR